MGMFDNIKVPKAYLKSLLSKEQEKLVDRTDFQTKSLDNSLFDYKIYKQHLFLKSSKKDGSKGKWDKVYHTGEITFYNLLKEESDVSYWVVFRFTFYHGKVDKKELITLELQQSLKDSDRLAPEEEQEWLDERDAFHKTFKYKFFLRLLRTFTRIHNWIANKTIPIYKKK